ncbi:DUF2182 domain-containing protein [Ruegeria sediminis]|uniref:DUF2182 domain-containing protein n=1 Tax=Ruegeria sediminis TaxID=2583820 RepID=A0ABY2X0L8_9RHOB|nr:DUF2182 domain-containing protein [Ruegeria sediminis]TMV08769.1 DUF2182 domain-containing protein [Ruegeria sediminis]
MLSDRIRAMSAPRWLALFTGIVAAWTALYLMAIPAEQRQFGAIYGADFWASLCTVTPDAAGFARMFAMWVLMSAAMMAPTVLPALATYEELGQSGADASMARLLGGYMSVWLGFSLVAAALQMGLFRAGLLDPLGQSGTVWLTAGLLGIAGLYQFSPVKDLCLEKCRSPMMFFMSHWDEGPWRNGIRLGLVCLGCCWALMLLAFVGGVMNLAFMGLATAIMVFEKLPELGRWITRPLGGLLIVASAAIGFGLV